MFASSSRLDLGITVGPKKPSHIKTILSSPLPIFVEYKSIYPEDITGSALWRMRAALRHCDRVREITFEGWSGADFGNFIRATNYHFPALESLVLGVPNGNELDIPATFLRGPDQLNLRLRRLRLCGASLPSVSGLLLSATALTDLTLKVSSNAAVIDSLQASLLLTCLQGMQCLRSLDLTTPYYPKDYWPQLSTPKDIVPLSKLTRFHYSGPAISLNNLMSGLSAPSLQDSRFVFCVQFPLFYLSRVIDNLREEFRSVSVTFDIQYFHLLSSIHLGRVDHFKPSFRFIANFSPDSINSTPSTKLAMVEELALFFPTLNITQWQQVSLLREFLRQFRSVRVLRVDPFMGEVALSLQQDDGDVILPVLEEIECSISRSSRYSYSDEEYRRRATEAIAAFEPFVSARERAGCLVKVRSFPL